MGGHSTDRAGSAYSADPIGQLIVKDFVTLTFTNRTHGGSYVRASLVRDPRRQCLARPMGIDAFFADITVPELLPPPGMRTGGGSGGGGSDTWSSSTKLQGTATPAAVGAHYAGQLVAAGWRRNEGTLDRDGMYVTTFIVPTKTADGVVGVLMVSRLPGTDQSDVFLRVVRSADARSFNSSLSIIR